MVQEVGKAQKDALTGLKERVRDLEGNELDRSQLTGVYPVPGHLMDKFRYQTINGHVKLLCKRDGMTDWYSMAQAGLMGRDLDAVSNGKVAGQLCLYQPLTSSYSGPTGEVLSRTEIGPKHMDLVLTRHKMRSGVDQSMLHPTTRLDTIPFYDTIVVWPSFAIADIVQADVEHSPEYSGTETSRLNELYPEWYLVVRQKLKKYLLRIVLSVTYRFVRRFPMVSLMGGSMWDRIGDKFPAVVQYADGDYENWLDDGWKNDVRDIISASNMATGDEYDEFVGIENSQLSYQHRAYKSRVICDFPGVADRAGKDKYLNYPPERETWKHQHWPNVATGTIPVYEDRHDTVESTLRQKNRTATSILGGSVTWHDSNYYTARPSGTLLINETVSLLTATDQDWRDPLVPDNTDVNSDEFDLLLLNGYPYMMRDYSVMPAISWLRVGESNVWEAL
jgi:hypothetical protein